MLERGSIWRRWDLHIHTPGTAHNDEFRNWEEFLDVIKMEPQVQVLGVTDYFLLDNYLKMKEYHETGCLPNVKLIIPNIEFRIAPPTNKETAVNIHLLISPDDPKHPDKILRALARLTWEYGGKKYSCSRNDLIDLGWDFNPYAGSQSAALSEGVTQFKVDFSTFRKWYEDEPWLSRNSLVVVDAGKDGLSGFAKKGNWAGYREEITRFADALFSGRPGERDFWLCKRTQEDAETVKRLGGKKPCLHGSDAHSIEELFAPAHDRYCWIKADTTFEGLRQVLYEPEHRVHIGPTPPEKQDKARVISDVKLSSFSSGFADYEIPFNSGLVSVIGQKGSGKSALAELAAYAAGAGIEKGSRSFLDRAFAHVEGASVENIWGNGASTAATIGEGPAAGRFVRYLSQDFVDRISARDEVGGELLEEIENVVFSYIERAESLNASSFEELRSRLTDEIRREGGRYREQVGRLIREQCELRSRVNNVENKKSRVESLRTEREGLCEQRPSADSAEEEATQEHLQGKRSELSDLENRVAKWKERQQNIQDVRGRTKAFEREMTEFYRQIEPSLVDIGVDEGAFAAFRPVFQGDPESILSAREEEAQWEIDALMGAEDGSVEGTVNAVKVEIEGLLRKQTVDHEKSKRIAQIDARVEEIDREIVKLNDEIGKVKRYDEPRIEKTKQEITGAYVEYCRNLLKEQEVLKGLYAPVTEHLQSEEALSQESKLDFYIRWEVDISSWMERGAGLFDQRRSIPYGTIEKLREEAERILVPAWQSGDLDEIRDAIVDFAEPFYEKECAGEKYVRSGVTFVDVLEWLYETEHVRLRYGVSYSGTALEKLSPGTKGIVLLILYLGMDVRDTRPLIVDQPDENLDNESVYDVLTEYFKEAKKRRQIVLITHNPNLVVNGDSEQVVIARAEGMGEGLPEIGYKGGALENPEVRKMVCDILEGGAEAFRKREMRYVLGENG